MSVPVEWIGHARKLCPADITLTSLPVINLYLFRFPSAILNLQEQEVSDAAGVGTTENLRTKITGISSVAAATEPDILLGVWVIYPLPHPLNLPPSLLATYVMKNTLAIGGSNTERARGQLSFITKTFEVLTKSCAKFDSLLHVLNIQDATACSLKKGSEL